MITTGIGFHDARINCEALALDETCIRTAAGEAAGDFDPQDRDGSVHRDADRIRARRGGDLIHDLFHAEGIRQGGRDQGPAPGVNAMRLSLIWATPLSALIQAELPEREGAIPGTSA
jgi:hypothetical protein